MLPGNKITAIDFRQRFFQAMVHSVGQDQGIFRRKQPGRSVGLSQLGDSSKSVSFAGLQSYRLRRAIALDPRSIA